MEQAGTEKDREQAVRERAYALWEREGRPAGKELDYWLRAETEIAAAAGLTDDPELAQLSPRKPAPARGRRRAAR